jgi:hypothetical protein
MGHKVSTLDNIHTIKLWCDRWYPTLVPDVRVHKWNIHCDERFTVPGRGRRENALFCFGKYGECPGYDSFRPPRYNKEVIEEMRTGLKMRVNMSLGKPNKYYVGKPTEKRQVSGLRKEVSVSMWDTMEKKQDEPHGWRE